MFVSMRDLFKEYTYSLQALSKDIALLDMLQSLARVAKENNYVRPKFQKEGIRIITGRHPVLEQAEDNFIPNDLVMDEEKIMLITGPNMSGKSTYMRQIALIAIMAQIGSFVSAKEAVLPLFDAIYTRIGASDDIISGESTFMVEMLEVNKALQNATSNSLIILDEIGRGTATYDGMSLAQSIIEYIHNNINAYTLFSTHYHELTALDQSLKKLKNIHVSIKERLGEVIFMHKVLPGAVDKSYGINVAKLAKLPLEIILRATDLLNKYEAQAVDSEKFSLANYQAPLIYDSKTELEKNILEELETIDLNKTSPLDALNKLSELQKKLKK
jgi:DNA mismatch repair protein MutS